jgi:hypothetical protein
MGPNSRTVKADHGAPPRCDTLVTSANALGGVAWINVEGRRGPFWKPLLWPTACCEGVPRAPRAEAARSLSLSCSSGGRYARLSLSHQALELTPHSVARHLQIARQLTKDHRALEGVSDEDLYRGEQQVAYFAER